MTRTAADFMAEPLLEAGVKRIYGIVGDSLNGFTDSLRRMKSIESICAMRKALLSPPAPRMS